MLQPHVCRRVRVPAPFSLGDNINHQSRCRAVRAPVRALVRARACERACMRQWVARGVRLQSLNESDYFIRMSCVLSMCAHVRVWGGAGMRQEDCPENTPVRGIAEGSGVPHPILTPRKASLSHTPHAHQGEGGSCAVGPHGCRRRGCVQDLTQATCVDLTPCLGPQATHALARPGTSPPTTH